MLKKYTFLLSLLLSSASFASSHAETSHLTKQRETYLYLEKLLPSLTFSEKEQKIIQRLLDSLQQYPLYENAQWAVLNAKIKQHKASEQEIAHFFSQYPEHPQRNLVAQQKFATLYQAGEYAQLIDYAKQITPQSIADQCRWFSANYQLQAAKYQINPELIQSTEAADLPAELSTLLSQFDQFWQFRTFPFAEKSNELDTTLPKDCADIEAFWRDNKMQTDEKIRQQAVIFAQKNAKDALQRFIDNHSGELTKWLESVLGLLNQPKNWQIFVQTQPLTPENKLIIQHKFPQFIRTLPENTEQFDFSPYETIAKNIGLSDDEINQWKIAFISRLFDNPHTDFQRWRDEQLISLKADNLTERRIRLALRQQAEISAWLDILSDEAKNKAEWRYWFAKNAKNVQQRQQQFASLAQERGFYPMLAAHQLGIAYQIHIPTVEKLTGEAQQEADHFFAQIQELHQLNKLTLAKQEWIRWLKNRPFAMQIVAADYALSQNWYTLAVEATIQAKAWDYLAQRLPNAYSEWFDIALHDSKISKTFAMAIARQESAWNSDARSHANAIGLMQMLPTTAEQTAKNQGLPYQNERSLLNPLNNILLGTAHLAELNEKYPNNRILIAAAYNAGSHRVTQWLSRANGKLSMDAFIASIPFLETRGYVQNVLAYDYYQQILQGKTLPIMFTPEESQKRY